MGLGTVESSGLTGDGAPWSGVRRPGGGTPVKPLSEEGYRCPRKHVGLAHTAPSERQIWGPRDTGPGRREGSSAVLHLLKPGGRTAMATVLSGPSSNCHAATWPSLRPRAPPHLATATRTKCLNEIEVTDVL